jgi:hypothetical protein
MRYELKRNKNGIITQCETNADGGNIYAQREEINKIALANLQRPTPGKLGDLSNLQVFNFNLSTIASGSDATIFREYNTTETTGNVTDCIMFNVDSLNNKALYYNVVDIKANINIGNANSELDADSYIQFYLLENIEGSTTSLGRKIPRRAPLNGTSSGTVTWTTTGPKQAFQYVQTDIISDSVNVPNTEGLRCSGLALKTILINFGSSETLDNVNIDFQIFVDVTSVSSSY